MKLFRIVSVLILEMFVSNVFGQNKYVIEYNRLSKSINHYNINSVDGKSDTVLLQNKPLLKKNDLLILRILEVNPFVFEGTINIKSNNWESKPTDNSLLTMFTGLGIGSMSGGVFDAISQFVNSSSSIEMTRGGSEVSDALKRLERIKENIRFIERQMNLIRNHEEAVQLVIHDPGKSRKEILEEAFYYLDEIESIDLSELQGVVSRSKSDLNILRIDSNAISFLEEIEKTENLIDQCDRALGIMNRLYESSAIEGVKRKYNNADFTVERRHIVGWEAKDNSNVYRYDIQFLLKKKSSLPVKNEEDVVRFYSANTFKNQKGEIVETNCQTCEPILIAKGQYKKGQNSMPLNVTDPNSVIFQFGSYGKWEFYDEDGEIISIVDLGGYPSVSDLNFQNQAGESAESDLNEFSSIEDIKEIQLGFGSPVRPQWVSGLYVMLPFQRETDIRTDFVGGFGSDSIQFVGEKRPSLKLALGTGMRFVFHNVESFEPSINLGISYSLTSNTSGTEFTKNENSSLNYMFGFGFRTKGIQYLSFDLGLALNQRTGLKENLQTNRVYSNVELNELGFGDYIFTENKWRSQLYFGVQFHF